MTFTIQLRLKEMYKRKQTIIEESGSLALVVLKKKDTDEFVKKVFPRLGRPSKATYRFNGAYNQGREDGYKVELNTPIDEKKRASIKG